MQYTFTRDYRNPTQKN